MSEDNEKEKNKQDEENPIEEYTLEELERVVTNSKDPYFCVDSIREPRTKRKLVDPRCVLTPVIVNNLYMSWGINRDRVIRVTRFLDAVDAYYNIDSKTINHYANQMHRYLSNIVSVEKSSYKTEIQGLAANAAEMLDGIFGYDKFGLYSVGPSDLRTVASYTDHLVNTSIYWLAAMSHMNRGRSLETGSMEAWRSKSKDEMRKITDPRGRKPELLVYYDYYGRNNCPAELEAAKKGDFSLVVSGFFGALFHDISLIRDPSILISIKGHIDDKLRQHPDASNQIIKNKLSILYDERPLTRSIIKNHHEYIDGSGYPGGKKEKDIHLFSQLLSVCDMYEEYTTRFVRGKVVKLITQGAGRIFSGEVVKAFLAILRPYDEGEILDGYEEKVKEPVFRGEVLQSDDKLHPKVKITEVLSEKSGLSSGATLDLSLPENIIYSI